MDKILNYNKPDRSARIKELDEMRTDKSESGKNFYQFIQSYDRFGKYYSWREKIFGIKVCFLIVFLLFIVSSNLLLVGSDTMQYSQEQYVKYLNFKTHKML